MSDIQCGKWWKSQVFRNDWELVFGLGIWFDSKSHVYYPQSRTAKNRVASNIEADVQMNEMGNYDFPAFHELQQKLGIGFCNVYMSYAQDAMHQIFLGVALKVADLWFLEKVCRQIQLQRING